MGSQSVGFGQWESFDTVTEDLLDQISHWQGPQIFQRKRQDLRL